MKTETIIQKTTHIRITKEHGKYCVYMRVLGNNKIMGVFNTLEIAYEYREKLIRSYG